MLTLSGVREGIPNEHIHLRMVEEDGAPRLEDKLEFWLKPYSAQWED